MRAPTQKVIHNLFDARIIVGIIGVMLSIVLHEAFHIILHIGEIQSFSIFPDHNALVSIFFVPSTGDVDLAFEEATAYLITIITLVLTVMLINDIHEARDKRSVEQILFPNIARSKNSRSQNKKSSDSLAKLLGIKNSPAPKISKRKK